MCGLILVIGRVSVLKVWHPIILNDALKLLAVPNVQLLKYGPEARPFLDRQV